MRRDLEKYLISVQKQRDEMVKAVDEANQLIIEGKISQEQAAAIQNYFNTVESNYQRILYCRYLYKLPPTFIQKLQKKKTERELRQYIEKQADAESIIKENSECIEKVGEIIDE